MKTSLQKFQELVDTEYPSIKKYITSKSESKIVLEDYDCNSTFGSNVELNPLFERPYKFPIKNFSVKHQEKHSYFIITIDLI